MTKFLFEIGLEEIPAHLVSGNVKQLKDLTTSFLKENRLGFKEITTFSTPRRLAIVVDELSDQTEAISEEVRGPSLKVARDEEGSWSKAAQGFARGQQADPADFIEKDGYVYLNKTIESVSAKEILKNFAAEVVEQMKFTTYMKWDNYSFEFVRPIRWMVALLDADVIGMNVLNVASDRVSYGHRFLTGDDNFGAAISIPNADDYQKDLADNFVIADADKRKQIIVDQIKEIESSHDWKIDLDEDLLEEVNNLVEYPTAFAGSFDEKYLEVPEPVLITSMKEHQRFFYVRDKQEKLIPYFIGVRNGNRDNLENVIAGNEKVLIARLEDAKFFFEEDKKQNINHFMEKVANLVFHAKIGTVVEHMQRSGEIAKQIQSELKLDVKDDDLNRLSQIYKFDLSTEMVNEFDELQGVMGEIYSNIFGESKDVALAIKEHYQPTSANGKLPSSQLGSLISVADKLDSIISFFKVDLVPSGSNDPYGLRRAASGLVKIILANQWKIDLSKYIDGDDRIKEFILDRLRKLNSDVNQDLVEAAISGDNGIDLVDIQNSIDQLVSHQSDANFRTVIESLSRVINIANKNPESGVVDSSLFSEDAEKKLADAVSGVQTNYESLATLEDVINNYFENVMVMDENPDIKSNRLRQLNILSNTIKQFASVEVINVK